MWQFKKYIYILLLLLKGGAKVMTVCLSVCYKDYANTIGQIFMIKK